jgi:hypothetical protein
MAKAKYSEKLEVNIEGFFTYDEDEDGNDIPVIQIEDADDVELLKVLKSFADREVTISITTKTEYA